jgi:hypothetical protein
MTRPVYVSTACLPGVYATLEQQLIDYRRHGMHRIEVGWCAPPRLPELAVTLAGTADDSVLIHNYFPPPAEPFVLNLAAQDEMLRSRSLTMAADALRLTAQIGAPFYSVHAGFAAEFSPAALGGTLERSAIVPREAALETFADSIEQLATLAESLDVALLIEPNVVEARNLVHGRNRLLLLADAEEITGFIEAIDHAALGLLLDTGHANVTTQTLGRSRDRFIDAVRPHVRALHVHDNDGRTDQHRPVEGDSWVWQVLHQPSLQALPAVIEARFDSLAALASHHSWFLQRDCEQ